MNIEMINNNHGANHVNDMEHITYSKPASSGSGMRTREMGFSLDISGKVTENAAYGKEDLKSAEEIAQMAGMTDVSVQRDYMAVMSNSMSDEDFAKLAEEGVNPTKIPVGESVTNLDRIKIKMAQSGTVIAGYNDDLTEDKIEAVLGGSVNADKIIADTLRSCDLPATGENIADIRETVSMARNLKPLSDEAKAFMISEDMNPTVENIYRAEYSASKTSLSSDGVRFDGAATYAGSEYTMSSWDELKDQVSAIIKEAGITETGEVMESAKWLAAHELPITKETLDSYEQLKDLSIPAPVKDVIAAATVAIEEGIPSKEADIRACESLYEKAAALVVKFDEMSAPSDLTKRRQLEEVRLAMTTEANLMLLRKGINIDTQPLEELVDELKAAEREFYAPLLGNKDNRQDILPEDRALEEGKLDEKIALFKQTMNAVEMIPQVPLRTIAEVSSSGDFSLSRIENEGTQLRTAYEKANETYEALMTAPRADMGDSIKKAFRNVDDILKDLDMDVNDSNRKAVRTLGYAGMMINEENVDSIRRATMSVERVISLMTPAKTLSMIREGHNPLRENIFDLEKSLSEESFEEESEKYSKFLLKLEHSGKITEDEKKTFIGIYRLFNTVEKQDGKAIGNVLSSGKELTLENMLEASRSNRHMNSEYIIDDDFGFLEQVVERGSSITSQIEAAFMQLADPAPDKSYIEEKQRDIRTAEKISKTGEDILNVIEQPVTVENILAAGSMNQGMGRGFKKMFSGQEREDKGYELSEEDARELPEAFGDRESAEDAYERFLDKAEKAVKAEMHRAETYEDVRTYSMLYKQVGFAAALAKSDSYEVPVQTEDGWTSIHVTVIHNGSEAGKVRTSFESESYGKVEASFFMKTNGVDGFITSDSRAGVDELKKIDDKIREEFLRENMDTANLSFVFSKNRTGEPYIQENPDKNVSDAGLYKIAKAFIKAVQKPQ